MGGGDGGCVESETAVVRHFVPEVSRQPSGPVSWFASAPERETKALRGTAGFSVPAIF